MEETGLLPPDDDFDEDAGVGTGRLANGAARPPGAGPGNGGGEGGGLLHSIATVDSGVGSSVSIL